jgi:geranylgeranyl diphosphate synthase type I
MHERQESRPTMVNPSPTVIAPPDVSDPAVLDQLLAPHLADAIAALARRAPLLAGMVRYHLGELGPDLQPTAPGTVDRGKRIRPAVAMLAAVATGGEAARAAPAAAAIELLHNFTLIHDDIQDESPTRRHRPTVWHQWGAGQAINAGDALFAAAHLPFFRLADLGVAPVVTLRLLEAFERTTIDIVAGQTLDLGFEGRADVTADDYLTMIAGKTAAIVQYAAWAGSLLGGVDDPVADQFAAFGLALGLGFQLRDDALGIWGAPAETGKARADDIRRRKQSLPILLLRDRAEPAVRAELNVLYQATAIDAAGIERVLALLAEHDVPAAMEVQIAHYHDQARSALHVATNDAANSGRDRLLALVERLAIRTG